MAVYLDNIGKQTLDFVIIAENMIYVLADIGGKYAVGIVIELALIVISKRFWILLLNKTYDKIL